ncbi:MAG: aromatic ring-hydroxylating dioxygenase subunit alpha [Gammaproteobacteria bacterium]|jgi:phenylpropionate dioxygenase-like ring-hydroxylating dioxygenase large terminal subunit|nr:MAG: aromatic ring-hydroxylating dioxygenase subunit alpha [Gammaproteobacteria bacterium]
MLLSDQEIIERVFDHIDHGSTDLGDEVWREPTVNYRSLERFEKELELYRRLPLPFAPSLALPNTGDYIARPVGGVPIIVVRHEDGGLRAFRNACRHRGVTLARGQGCTRVFTCGYHGWAYGLDGALQHVPHESGFPDLNKAEYGLVPIDSVTEKGGLIFVSIEPPVDDGALAELPDLIGSDQAIFQTTDRESDFNWKLNIEATLEGYHIKPTHRETFYPYGYDNMNVVETFGPNARVTFPFRRIEKLRDLPPPERDISGRVTYAYNIFPNATVAVLSNHTAVSFSEPISPTRTRYFSFRVGNKVAEHDEEAAARMRRDADFVSDTGTKEDAEMVHRIQEGLASGANSHFLYGHYEKAIVNFHQNMTRLIDRI